MAVASAAANETEAATTAAPEGDYARAAILRPAKFMDGELPMPGYPGLHSAGETVEALGAHGNTSVTPALGTAAGNTIGIAATGTIVGATAADANGSTTGPTALGTIHTPAADANGPTAITIHTPAIADANGPNGSTSAPAENAERGGIFGPWPNEQGHFTGIFGPFPLRAENAERPSIFGPVPLGAENAERIGSSIFKGLFRQECNSLNEFC